MDARTPFLKTWYLLWESFRHVHGNQPIPTELDFMPAALAAFPSDARVLLAAGSRYELAWSMSLENAQRDLEREPFGVTKLLTTARDYLRRSLAADSGEGEARLRLAHVLLELNELSSVAPILSSHDWTPDGPAFEYLARLFEGDLHERKGDRAAAAAAYDRAIALVDAPQSALVAKAHLAHLDGRRAEAARDRGAGLVWQRQGGRPLVAVRPRPGVALRRLPEGGPCAGAQVRCVATCSWRLDRDRLDGGCDGAESPVQERNGRRSRRCIGDRRSAPRAGIDGGELRTARQRRSPDDHRRPPRDLAAERHLRARRQQQRCGRAARRSEAGVSGAD